MCFSDDKQADTIDAFNTTSRYLDDISEEKTFPLTLYKGRGIFQRSLLK